MIKHISPNEEERTRVERGRSGLNPLPEISVVVPVHDEEENIVPLAGEVRSALAASFDYELIFVNDGSGDGTLDRLRELAGRDPRVRALSHGMRSGQSMALCSGVRAARAPLVATLDGDRQNDPADIPRLVETIRDPARPARLALVAGMRTRRRDSLVKRISSRIANGVRSRILHDRTPDTGCGLKVFLREAFLALPHFDHMHRYLPALFLGQGWEVRSVEVRHRPRAGGRTHYGTLDRLGVGIVDLFGVLWLLRRSKIPEVTEVGRHDT